MSGQKPSIAIIGAGIGGLAAALRLSYAGLDVTVLERHESPGGKMRTVPSDAGPVDAGPTVLTMKPVFDALFASVGERLDDHITLTREDIIARHFWSDGTMFDLMADPEATLVNVRACFCSKAEAEFHRFTRLAGRLFEAFDRPMMQAVAPSRLGVTRHVMCQPSLIPAMAPHLSMAQSLARQFSDPKLAQLFGRYATYVGGDPMASPAILSLISHAEARGVWSVKGGMHQLARAIEALAQRFGSQFCYGAEVQALEPREDGGFDLHHGNTTQMFDKVLFNGDPRALAQGFLGPAMRRAAKPSGTEPRSLSAYVHAFAAKVDGPMLAGHNVFFADRPNSEFPEIANSVMPTDPTLYICAQDRFGGKTPSGAERFEIIMNGAPVPDGTAPDPSEIQTCQTRTEDRLRQFGLSFDQPLTPPNLTTPAEFGQMFPATNGSLYGRSPHGMMAAFQRPTARTAIKGLYLVGGGAHPGAGVPMATLSARHAVEAILADLTSISPSRQVVTHGGISTVSAIAEPKRSPSSPL